MKILIKINIVLLIFLSILGLYPQKVQATAGETPFGGFSVAVIPCLCSGNFLIFHVPPVAGPSPIIYNPLTSVVYPYFNITKPFNWILGNVKSIQACRIWVIVTCVTIAESPVITIVGTSDPSKIAMSSSAFGNNSDNNNNQTDNPEPPPSDDSRPPQRPTGEGGETPAENGQTEAQTRAGLQANGVQIAPGLSPTLSPVSKLPNNAIAGVEDLKQDCGPNCNVVITSGARQPGNPTPPGEHGTGQPVFDLNKDPGLNSYIQNNASSNYTNSSGTHYVMPNGDEYLDENYGATGGTGAHWHVRINADHMAPTA